MPLASRGVCGRYRRASLQAAAAGTYARIGAPIKPPSPRCHSACQHDHILDYMCALATATITIT